METEYRELVDCGVTISIDGNTGTHVASLLLSSSVLIFPMMSNLCEPKRQGKSTGNDADAMLLKQHQKLVV
jgi:hypothetical protein